MSLNDLFLLCFFLCFYGFSEVHSEEPSRGCVRGRLICLNDATVNAAAGFLDAEILCQAKKTFIQCMTMPRCPEGYKERSNSEIVEDMDKILRTRRYPCPYTREDAIEDIKRFNSVGSRPTACSLSVILSGLLVLVLRSL
ncbi:hypothetical protein BgiMline_010506 [Biomphalaria glabrata]|uniref:Uncharacterized protein LOC106066356 isoform X1 n=1 Tax=Biomphalaria glabrata TaxID=6526 RepID=A0A9W3AAH7_BIOGL|nr:uncharacterized protein LOC106066356 isoform X1 [Biomphalaria glabrata]XP_013080802.2 uncharacterized protein LOC106066356 isoform X1 [Biomphalaria glabrata]XP_055884211.1 uncharacterized protein LOC106066356 isoform X1 [Biomphalaria glabrata]KAI8739677.1 hypothetical protein BgiMline_024232 [Biomphalaria glabrata]KAI8771927.1 hypothetical protein BgiBS90_027462 [Biomphalaria glabrata]